MDFRLHLLEAITDNFSEQRKVGTGGYATVYKVCMTNLCVSSTSSLITRNLRFILTGHQFQQAVYNGQAIAVKKLHQLQGLDDKDFQNEYLNLVKLSEHPNVIRLIGYCHDTHGMFVKHNGELIFARQLERLLCFEYMERGDLSNYITGMINAAPRYYITLHSWTSEMTLYVCSFLFSYY
jgi:interleukin-1 receptor-associated kinase 1